MLPQGISAEKRPWWGLRYQSRGLRHVSHQDQCKPQVLQQGFFHEGSPAYPYPRFGEFTIHPRCRFSGIQQHDELMAGRDRHHPTANVVVQLVGDEPAFVGKIETSSQPAEIAKRRGLDGASAFPGEFVPDPLG